MPFEYRTICKPDNFWPFEYQTSPVFRWLLCLIMNVSELQWNTIKSAKIAHNSEHKEYEANTQ